MVTKLFSFDILYICTTREVEHADKYFSYFYMKPCYGYSVEVPQGRER